MIRALTLAAALAAPLPAAANAFDDMLAACMAQTGDVAQAASLLSTIGWGVGGDIRSGTEARAMTLPYLAGYGEQELRRNGLTIYKDEMLARAAEEAAMSIFMTSPDGGTLMMTHTGSDLTCTYALPGSLNISQMLAAAPGETEQAVQDPQMVAHTYRPSPPPQGVRSAIAWLWDPDADDYTQINPVRPRNVDMIITIQTRM